MSTAIWIETGFNDAVLQRAKKDIYISGRWQRAGMEIPVCFIHASQGHTHGPVCRLYLLVVDMNVVYRFISDNMGLGNTGETFLVKKILTISICSSAPFYTIIWPF